MSLFHVNHRPYENETTKYRLPGTVEYGPADSRPACGTAVSVCIALSDPFWHIRIFELFFTRVLITGSRNPGQFFHLEIPVFSNPIPRFRD